MPGHGRGNATTTAPTTTKPRSHTLKRLVKYILADKLRVAVVIIACGLGHHHHGAGRRSWARPRTCCSRA